MMNKINKATPNPFEDDQLELLFIDPAKDIYTARVVLGPAPVSFYKAKLIHDIVEQIVTKMQPTPIEKEGYEILEYKLVIKKYDK